MLKFKKFKIYLLSKINYVFKILNVNQILKGSSWNLIGTVVSQVTMLFLGIIVSRMILNDDFGKFSLIRSTVLTFSVLIGIGIGVVNTNLVSKNRLVNIKYTHDLIFTSIVLTTIITLLVSVTLLLFEASFSNMIFVNNQQSLIYKFFVGLLFFTVINLALTGVLQGLKEYTLIAKIAVYTSLVTIFITVISTYYFRLEGAIFGLAIGAFFSAFFLGKNIYVKIYKTNTKLSFLKNEILVLLKFGIPVMLASQVPLTALWYVNFIVTKSQNGYLNLGILDSAMRYTSMIVLIPNSISQVILPLLNQNISYYHKFREIIKSALRYNLIISITISFAIVCFSEELMSLYNSNFSSYNLVLIVLSISTVFISLNSIFTQFLLTQNAVWQGFILNLLWAFLYISISSYFIRINYGAKGVAYAHLISYAIYTLISYIYYLKKINLVYR
jgi:O-antigen/teichoic acid export membrane protein